MSRPQRLRITHRVLNGSGLEGDTAMTNKPAKQPATSHQMPKWQESLNNAGIIFFIVIMIAGGGLSFWDNRDLFKHWLMACSAFLFGLPQWLNVGIILIVWFLVTAYGTQRQVGRTPRQLQKRSLRLAGVMVGLLFYVFQNAALAFIKTVVGMVVLLILSTLSAGGLALPFGFFGFGGGMFWYDDWDGHDDDGHWDDY